MKWIKETKNFMDDNDPYDVPRPDDLYKRCEHNQIANECGTCILDDEEVSAKVEMKLVGEDGNAFAILGRFQKAAKKAGWSKEKTDAVLKEARSGDYNHLLATIMEYVEED